jgi:hypothetical protein
MQKKKKKVWGSEEEPNDKIEGKAILCSQSGF